MAEVYRRKFVKYTLTAVTLFYSGIILKKLTTENKTTFRKLEKSVKLSVKCDADIKFIKIHNLSTMHHLPAFGRDNKQKKLQVRILLQ